ncbi:MAG: ABC transporter ATP-binding protein [Acidimicrobiales bacterium]
MALPSRPASARAPATPPARDAGALVIDHVSKDYRTGSHAAHVLDDVSLRVEAGQFVTIIGPSGCGKSTLLRIAAGLLHPDRGSVSIFGEPPERARDAHIGYVPQTPSLLPWRTVLANVELALQLRARAGRPRPPDAGSAREMLERFGLAHVLDRRPHELSGGMQQRVAIARSFIIDPTVLLMDEPFSSLDELTRDAQGRELLRLWQWNQKTVLFVTHSVSEAVAFSDVIVVMSSSPGRIATIIPVALARPRDEGRERSAARRDLEDEVRDELRRHGPPAS